MQMSAEEREALVQALTQAGDEAERSAVILAAAIARGLKAHAPPHMIDRAARQFEVTEREIIWCTEDGTVIRVLAPLGEAIRTAARTRDPHDIRRLFDLAVTYLVYTRPPSRGGDSL